MSTAALILAAGEGTRMRSDLPKVAHPILGVPMVRMVVDTAREAGCDPIVVITGHRGDVVSAICASEQCVDQEEQLGTGHAVMAAEKALAGFDGSVLVLSGDTPLMRTVTLAHLVEEREAYDAAVCVLTTRMGDPTGYGRIVRGPDGSVDRIVEHRDSNADEAAIDEVNTGTYCFDARTLFDHLHRLERHNAQGEYYLTDMVGVFRSEGLRVVTVTTEEPDETMGVNSREQLAQATAVLQKRVNDGHMAEGVTIPAPDLAWIAPTVRLGRDVTVAPMTFLLGDTVVEDGATVGPSTRVTDSHIGPGAVVDCAVLVGAKVGAGANVGPFAYLRPGTVLEARAKAGTFVEIKNTTVGEGSKVPHLSYMGDAELGREVNIGAGSITCNYDGREKHRTKIGDGAFIGSDTMLVAPVEVGENAITGAGSAITKDVPPGSLGIERTDQRNVEGWAERKCSGETEKG